MNDIIQSQAFLLGDDINTDLHCSSKYLPGKDEAFVAAQAFEAVSPGFAKRFKPGGIIVAGKHFGINSSREQALNVLHRLGVAAIVAPSFGRQFFRNAINNGLPVLECEIGSIRDQDAIELNLLTHTLHIPARTITRPLRTMPTAIRAILREGGLLPFLEKHPTWEMPA